MAIDEEGNGFQSLYETGVSRWHEKWKEIKIFELTDDLRQKGYTEDDVNIDLPPVLVLWP